MTGFTLDHWRSLAHDAGASYALENGRWMRLYYVAPRMTWDEEAQQWVSDQSFDDNGDPVQLFSTDPTAGPPVIPHEDSIGENFFDEAIQITAKAAPLIAAAYVLGPGAAAGEGGAGAGAAAVTPLETTAATLEATVPESVALQELPALPIDTVNTTMETLAVEPIAPFDAGALAETELAPIPESVLTPTVPSSLPFEIPSIKDAVKYAQQARSLLASKVLPKAPLPHQVAHASLTAPELPAAGASASVIAPVVIGVLLALLR